MKKASKKGAIGAGLEALGPPAITIGSPSPRSVGAQRDAGQVEHLEHVRVGQLGLQRDAEQVGLAHRPPRSRG